MWSAHVCSCRGQKRKCFPGSWSVHLILRQNSHLNSELTNLAHLAYFRDPLSPPPAGWAATMFAWLLDGFWRSELPSSYLCNKGVTLCTISPARLSILQGLLMAVYMENILRMNRRGVTWAYQAAEQRPHDSTTRMLCVVILEEVIER